MVVSVEDLDCLDLIIWLRTGEQVASRLSASQSKISRTAKAVAECFGVALVKVDGQWEVRGDQVLLNLERRLHQCCRWSRGDTLRIEAQYYSGPLFCSPPPAGWMAGNFNYLEIHTPLRLLRDGVIDAWIGCYPDLPEPDDPDLISFHLTRLPTHLVVRADHPLLAGGAEISLDDVREFPSLALPDGAFPKVQAALQELGLWNRPMALNRYSRSQWEGRVEAELVIGYASALTLSLFTTPQVILPVPIPLEVGDSLVVRRDFADHPRLQELLLQLRHRARQLAQAYPDVSIPEA